MALFAIVVWVFALFVVAAVVGVVYMILHDIGHSGP